MSNKLICIEKMKKNNFEVVRLMTPAATCDAPWVIEVIANHRTAGGLDRVLPTFMTASIPSRIQHLPSPPKWKSRNAHYFRQPMFIDIHKAYKPGWLNQLQFVGLQIIIDILDDNYQNNQIIFAKIFNIMSGTLFYRGYYHDNIMIKQ